MKKAISVEKNITPPDLKQKCGRPDIWGRLFKQCTDVGDSFFVPECTTGKLSPTVNYWNAKLKPWKFCIRARDAQGEVEMNKDGVHGIRIWRAE